MDTTSHRTTDRKLPRRSRRDAHQHVDRYAPEPKTEDDLFAEALVALAAHFNSEEASRG